MGSGGSQDLGRWGGCWGLEEPRTLQKVPGDSPPEQAPPIIPQRTQTFCREGGLSSFPDPGRGGLDSRARLQKEGCREGRLKTGPSAVNGKHSKMPLSSVKYGEESIKNEWAFFWKVLEECLAVCTHT